MIDHPMPSLARIRVVLVATSHPGNIGAVARATKTMGLARLDLVTPRQPLGAEALARASGADDLLAAAHCHDSLVEALGGCRLVVGSSARLRTIDWPQLDPRACGERLVAESAHGEVALVMGRESSGLTNDELARCHYLAHIPANPDYSSLNLAAATQVFVYEIRRAYLAAMAPDRTVTDGAVTGGTATGAAVTLAAAAPDLATAEQMEGFFGHLRETLFQLGFSDPEQSRTLMKRLRRLFNRARPDRVELNILRGILGAAQGRKTSARFARTADVEIGANSSASASYSSGTGDARDAGAAVGPRSSAAAPELSPPGAPD